MTTEDWIVYGIGIVAICYMGLRIGMFIWFAIAIWIHPKLNAQTSQKPSIPRGWIIRNNALGDEDYRFDSFDLSRLNERTGEYDER